MFKSTLIAIATFVSITASAQTSRLSIDADKEFFADRASNFQLVNVRLVKVPTQVTRTEKDCGDGGSCADYTWDKTALAVEGMVLFDSTDESGEARLYIAASEFSAAELAQIKNGQGKSIVKLSVKNQAKTVSSIDYGRSELCQNDSGTIPGCVRDVVYNQVSVNKVIITLKKK